MLQKKGKILKAFVLCLCLVLAMPLMMPVFADGETETVRMVYKSSENFSLPSENNTTNSWDGELWYPQVYNPVDDVYTNMTGKQESRNGRSEDGNETAPAFYGTNSSNSPNVSAYWIAPGSGNTVADNKYSAVKTFAVPRTGVVSISFGSKFFAKSKVANARIVHTSNSGSTEIWPEDADFYEVAIDNATIPENITLSVRAGERIRFEISRIAADFDSNAYYSKVYWDPVISYIPDTFQSSTNFSTADEDGVWDGGLWKAQMFDPETNTYAMLTNFASKGSRDELGTANGNVYYGTHIDNSPNLNGWWMSTGNNNGTYTTAEDQNSAVKTFVAPKSGYVTVSFADGLYSATNSSPDAKITVSSNGAISKVWPKDADFYTLPKTVSGVITYIDETATFFVNEGDEINFEVHIPSGTTAAFYSKVHWDPVINYIPYTSSVVTSLSDGTYQVKVSETGIKTVSDIIVAGYKNDNQLCDVKVLSSSSLTSPAVLTGEVSYVKVMTWSSVSELFPKTHVEVILQNEFVQGE